MLTPERLVFSKSGAGISGTDKAEFDLPLGALISVHAKAAIRAGVEVLEIRFYDANGTEHKRALEIFKWGRSLDPVGWFQPISLAGWEQALNEARSGPGLAAAHPSNTVPDAPLPTAREAAPDAMPNSHATFCSQCGTRQTPGGRFCTSCGASSQGATPAATAAAIAVKLWSPRAIGWLTFFTGFPSGIILWVLNTRRMGLAKRARGRLLAGIVGVVVVIVCTFLLPEALVSGLLLATSWGVPIYLAKRTSHDTTTFVAEGGHIISESWVKGLALGIGTLVILLIGVLILGAVLL